MADAKFEQKTDEEKAVEAEQKLVEQQEKDAKEEEKKAQEKLSEDLAETYQQDAVKRGLELKKIRDEENALIKLAEEYLAKQEKEAKTS